MKRETQQSNLRKSGYITRVDRAKRLNEVPPENVALVQKHLKKLKTVFPADLAVNPLDAVADLEKERGMPFEEMKPSGFDIDITWDSTNAEIGVDSPDPIISGTTSARAGKSAVKPLTKKPIQN